MLRIISLSIRLVLGIAVGLALSAFPPVTFEYYCAASKRLFWEALFGADFIVTWLGMSGLWAALNGAIGTLIGFRGDRRSYESVAVLPVGFALVLLLLSAVTSELRLVGYTGLLAAALNAVLIYSAGRAGQEIGAFGRRPRMPPQIWDPDDAAPTLTDRSP